MRKRDGSAERSKKERQPEMSDKTRKYAVCITMKQKSELPDRSLTYKDFGGSALRMVFFTSGDATEDKNIFDKVSKASWHRIHCDNRCGCRLEQNEEDAVKQESRSVMPDKKIRIVDCAISTAVTCFVCVATFPLLAYALVAELVSKKKKEVRRD